MFARLVLRLLPSFEGLTLAGAPVIAPLHLVPASLGPKRHHALIPGPPEQARAEAEQELQTVRREMETKRLIVEVVLPADASRRAAECIAEGEAAISPDDEN